MNKDKVQVEVPNNEGRRDNGNRDGRSAILVDLDIVILAFFYLLIVHLEILIPELALETKIILDILKLFISLGALIRLCYIKSPKCPMIVIWIFAFFRSIPPILELLSTFL